MALVTPVGGHVYNGAVAVPVNQWSGNWQGRLVEVTQTDGAGGTVYAAFVVDPDWSFTLFLDDADAAVAAGFVIGTKLALVKFKLGGLSTFDKVANTTVGGISRVLNANGDPIGVTVSGKGGTLTLNAA